MNTVVRNFWIIGLIAVSAALSGCAGDGQAQASGPPPEWTWPPIEDFMTTTTEGTGFQDGFRFMGTNLDPWRFNTKIGEIYSRDEIERWVADAVQYTHARVIRVHMNGGAFEPSVGVYGEPAFKQMDSVLAAAAKYNVYVLIDLRDYCWTPWPPGKCYDPYWYMNGGSPSNPKKDNILTDPDAIAAFKDYIFYVVNRVNTVTGVTYKNDPHIIGWEIINEPNMVPGIKNWFMDIGDYVKSVDPNDLIGTATIDISYGYETGSPELEALKADQLDFIDIHYYADYYNPGNTNWVSRYTQILQSIKTLNKPVIIGEFGFPNNYAVSRLKNYYQKIILISFNEGLAGVMPYSWGPPGPNYLGASGSFCIYTGDTEICNLLRDLTPAVSVPEH